MANCVVCGVEMSPQRKLYCSKECTNKRDRRAWSKQYREANKEVIAEKKKQDWLAHLEERRREMRERRQSDPDKYRRLNKESRDRHLEKRRADTRARYALHREERAAYQREYRRVHGAEIEARRRVRYQANKELIAVRRAERYAASPQWRKNALEASRRRKAVIRGAPSTEIFSRDEIYERDQGICHICGQPADQKDWHLDHILPLSAGGPHTRDNVAVAHKHCNLSKGRKILV